MTTKTYSKQWKHKGGIIRARGNAYQVEIHRHGKRMRHTESTLAAAKTYIEQKTVALNNQGLKAIALTDNQRIDALAAIDLLPKGITLEAAAKFWVQHNPRSGTSEALPALFDLYLDKRSDLRPSTLKEIRARAGRFVSDHEGAQPQTVTREVAKRWLDDSTCSRNDWKKHQTLLKVFYDFMVNEGYAELNPFEGLKPSVTEVRQAEIECYSADEAEGLLRAAEKHAPAVVPTIAIGLFAGLRPSEVDLLDWENVNFRTKRIRVTSETAKKRRSRSVEMHPNLIQWLLPHKCAEGRVGASDSYFRSVRSKLLKEAKIDRWIHDGLRHTFGSMHVEHFKKAEETARQMGHRDLRVMYDHYVQAVDDPEDAARFWRIHPAEQAEVIQHSFAAGA